MKHDKIRVIIVDDHRMVRETWKMLLEGYNDLQVIKEYGSGAEAIHAASSLDPHVILMDVNMNPVNGFQATQAILEKSPHIHIIGMSVNNQPGYAKNMMQLGAKGYVTKNSSREEMFQAISEVMQGKTYICKEVLDQMEGS